MRRTATASSRAAGAATRTRMAFSQNNLPQLQRLAAGGRLAAGDAIFEAGRIRARSATRARRAGVSKNAAESAGGRPQCQLLLR
eukprot:4151939-Prymnesium_polylepis.1